MADLEAIAAALRRFGMVEAPGESALYARLALAAADDRDLLEVAAHRREGQPVANMLFGSVQYLLAKEPGNPLAGYYPTLGGNQSEGDPFPLFREYVLAHREQVVGIIASHMVQTNEVRRSAGLFPAFSEVWGRTGKPLGLIEIGPSAGLNLIYDRYAYDYGRGIAGDPGSLVLLRCESRGAEPPVALPMVTSRVGIDLNPLDVRDEEAMRWLRALVWPEHTDRLALLNAAIEVAHDDPPALLGGDVFELLPGLIRAADPASIVCVFATFVLNQFTEEMRGRLRALLLDASRETEICFVVMGYSEFVTMQPEAPFEGSLWLARLGRASRAATRLARFHHHGRWLDWGPEEFPLDW
ncbi:MAG: DUF2332 domain-containing protein [Anaerolinea sp.]|nr:DUF2332 domain-containing protein [Anaerolinea sp.]